jgi:universal stress protein A
MTKEKYSKILLAVDFLEDSQIVVETAQDMAELYNAELHVVHVSELLSVAYSPEGVSWGTQIYTIEAEIRAANKKKLGKMAVDLKIGKENCHLLDGRPSTQIHELSKELDVDLIVMGTHGQSGLQLLLGSTANSVLHGVCCDVLAVRIKG